ncbi:hypothetical protein [Kitasatospora sp. NPDC007106]|uniref:hypothetical protein n=1 Tax=Kitasatospora sp. NPDC007106 TaxID=3156914 RepID=UPI0033EBC378
MLTHLPVPNELRAMLDDLATDDMTLLMAPLPRSWEASSAKVTSRMWCSASMDQWPRIRAASCAGVACPEGRPVTA